MLKTIKYNNLIGCKVGLLDKNKTTIRKQIYH